MSWEENWQRKVFQQEAERQLVRHFARVFRLEVWKLQGSEDDGGTDAILGRNGEELSLEARRKGYPNYRGEVCHALNRGWETGCIKYDGVYLNELTIARHRDEGTSFIYLVQFAKGPDPIRAAPINLAHSDELLAQPVQWERSTNTGNMQSVKLIPVDWFKRLVPMDGLEGQYR